MCYMGYFTKNRTEKLKTIKVLSIDKKDQGNNLYKNSNK